MYTKGMRERGGKEVGGGVGERGREGEREREGGVKRILFSYIDVNECADTGSSLCQQRCVNTRGGFKCTCDEWHVLNGSFNCQGL